MMDANILKSMGRARDDRERQASRQRRVSKMFWDLEQQALYPGANVLSLPGGDTLETLSIQEPDYSDEQNFAALEQNLRLLSRGNVAFVESVKEFILKSYSSPSDIASFLVASWDDVKLELKKAFGGKSVQPNAFIPFIRRYLNDAGEKATTSPAAKPTPAEVGFTVFQGSATMDELDANYDKAWQYDSVLVQEVLEKKHANKDLGELTKAQLVALQKGVYFALYGKAWEGQGKKGAAAGQVDYGDVHAPDSAFKGAPPSKKQVTGNGLAKKKGKPPVVYGRGVSSQISQRYYVDLKKANQSPPRLSVKYKSTARSVMDVEVTPAVKAIVMGILSNKLDERQYAKLSSDKKDQVLLFLASSGAKTVPVYIDAVEEVSKKLTILVVEINAGNDSEVVRSMALDAALRLYRYKSITRLEYLSPRDSM